MATVVALGNFDGLHKGHMVVINNCKEMAERLSAMPFALVFKEHPLKTLTGEAPVCLFNKDSRADAFKNTGVRLCLLDFEPLMNMSPKKFFEEIIVKRMGAVGVCCGFNYTFGKDGKGTPKLLKKYCDDAGIEFSMAPEFDFEDEPVSSSRIRKALEEGSIELANFMLGRPYSFKLQVQNGAGRGRHLGAPTINQAIDPALVVPAYGVYMSRTTIEGKRYLSITNIGVRPTIHDDNTPSIETYILDFSGDLYGKYVEVALLSYIRPETKFDSLVQLENQISLDERKVRKLAQEAVSKIKK